MSLLKRITEDTGTRAADRLRDELRKAQREQDERQAVRSLVVAALFSAGDKIGEKVTVVRNEDHQPVLAVLGDVLLKVEPFTTARKEVDLARPHLIAQEYAVALIGVDPTGFVYTSRVGMLALLSYEGLFRVVASKQGLNFNASDVLRKLDF